jgi:secreted PhoX family phosphatase
VPRQPAAAHAAAGLQIHGFGWNGEKNDIVGDKRGSEFAGACFSSDGHWLFASMQDPGITFAITRPWQAGAL